MQVVDFQRCPIQLYGCCNKLWAEDRGGEVKEWLTVSTATESPAP